MSAPKPPQPERKPPVAAAKPPTSPAETKRPTDSVPMQTGSFAKLPLRFGRYQVEKLLGKGAMGAVYLARDTQLDRLVALKIPKISASAKGSEKLLKRLKTEAMAAAQIDHPSVCPVFDSGDLGGVPYIVMQFIEGETLKNHLKNQAQTPQEAVELIRQLAEGLAEAHSRKIYHRDLKPENIKLNRRGVPVIMDFGLAKLATTLRADASATQAGTTLGTPAYMSPEQAGGKVEEIDHRSDLYALGVMLYEMLTGTWPFSGSAIQVMGQKSVLEPPSPLTIKPELNPQLAAVCHKMIAKDRQNRYQTAEEVIAALKALNLTGSPPGGATGALEAAGQGGDADIPSFETEAGSLAAIIARQRKPGASSETTAHPAQTLPEVAVGPSASSVASRRSRAGARQPANLAQQKIWIGIGAGMLVVAVLVLWAAGVFKVKTREGILVLEVNEPDAEVFVDGAKVSVTWGKGEKGGRTATVNVPPGEHKIKVSKEGFSVAARKLTFKEGEREVFKARLEARDAPAEKTVDSQQPSPPPPEPGAEATAVATEPGGSGADDSQPFFNGKDLAGWEGLPGYWQVRDGAIVGASANGVKAHTFLCSQKKYKDFELRFQVRRKNGVGNSGVLFRSQLTDAQRYVVTGPKVEIAAAEFTPPGSVVNEPWAAPALWANRAVVAKVWKNDDFNEMLVRCFGDHVIVSVNGVPVVDASYGPKIADEGIIAWQLHGNNSPEEITFKDIQFADLTRGDPPLSESKAGAEIAAPDDDGFVPLFNGKDLAGWKTHPKEPGNWRVEGAAIVGSGSARSHLYSERGDFADFHLRVGASINDGGNSGVWFRTTYGPVWPANNPQFPLACEANISPEATGTLFISHGGAGSGKPVASAAEQLAKANEWFTMEIIARDNHLLVKVNGRTAVDFMDEKRQFTRGHLALQVHKPETVVKFRRIEIREGKPLATDVPKPHSAITSRGSKLATDYAAAVKKAEETLSSRFDKALELLRRGPTNTQDRQKLIEAVKVEKTDFDTRKRLPWSAPMRAAAISYLRDLGSARATLQKGFDRRIAESVKAKKDADAEELRAEFAAIAKPHLLGIWSVEGLTVKSNGDLRYYSNGTGRVETLEFTWTLETGAMITRLRKPNDPGFEVIGRATIAADGNTFTQENNQNNKYFGRLNRNAD